jgi:transcriptional regulator with XRE-family HTH domain
MPREPQPNPAEIIADFRGVYARVARKLNVSASQVSRVACGNRNSEEIMTALHEEILKKKLDSYV